MPITRHPIAKARQGRGLDRETLARRCGTTAVEIESWEEGLYWPQPDVAVRMARVLQLSLAEIYISLIEREERAGRIPLAPGRQRVSLARLHQRGFKVPGPANDAPLEVVR